MKEDNEKNGRDTVPEMLQRTGGSVFTGRGHIHDVHGGPYTSAGEGI